MKFLFHSKKNFLSKEKNKKYRKSSLNWPVTKQRPTLTTALWDNFATVQWSSLTDVPSVIFSLGLRARCCVAQKEGCGPFWIQPLSDCTWLHHTGLGLKTRWWTTTDMAEVEWWRLQTYWPHRCIIEVQFCCSVQDIISAWSGMEQTVLSWCGSICSCRLDVD